MKDILLLVKPDFMDKGQGPFYCPDTAPVEGMLGFYPQLRERLDVRYIEFTRPRTEVISLLGESNQGLPVLIISSENLPKVKELGVNELNGVYFLDDQAQIRS